MYAKPTPKIFRYQNMKNLGLNVKPLTSIAPFDFDEQKFLRECKKIFDVYGALMLRTDSIMPTLNLPMDLGANYDGILNFKDFKRKYRKLRKNNPDLYVLGEAFLSGRKSINIIVSWPENYVEITENIPMPYTIKGEVTPLGLWYKDCWKIHLNEELVPLNTKLNGNNEWLKEFGLSKSTLFQALDTIKPYVTEESDEWFKLASLGGKKSVVAETIIYKPKKEHLFLDYTCFEECSFSRI